MNELYKSYDYVSVPGPGGDKSFLYMFLKDQPIWQSLRFWNAAFFDAVQCERSRRPMPTKYVYLTHRNLFYSPNYNIDLPFDYFSDSLLAHTNTLTQTFPSLSLSFPLIYACIMYVHTYARHVNSEAGWKHLLSHKPVQLFPAAKQQSGRSRHRCSRHQVQEGLHFQWLDHDIKQPKLPLHLWNQQCWSSLSRELLFLELDRFPRRHLGWSDQTIKWYREADDLEPSQDSDILTGIAKGLPDFLYGSCFFFLSKHLQGLNFFFQADI